MSSLLLILLSSHCQGFTLITSTLNMISLSAGSFIYLIQVACGILSYDDEGFSEVHALDGY